MQKKKELDGHRFELEGENLSIIVSEGLSFTISLQIIKIIIQILYISAMARLLQPSDFGLVAIVSIYINAAMHLVDAGLSIATIQHRHITHSQISKLFWTNGSLGVALFVFIALFSPLLAKLYQDPRVISTSIVMGFTLIIGGILVQPDALLRRQMRFRAASIVDLISILMGIGSGFIAAIMGMGFWSLVVQPSVTIFMKTLLSFALVKWTPTLIIRDVEAKKLYKFGFHITGSNVINYATSYVTPFAIGLFGGAQFLGLYNRSSTITSIPTIQILPAIMKVLQPILSRVANDRDRMKRAIDSIYSKIIIITMIPVMLMTVLADLVVHAFLGVGWEGATQIVRMLALLSLVETIDGFLSTSIISGGHVRQILRWKIVTLIILISSILIGAQFESIGIVFAVTITGIFIRFPLMLMMLKHLLSADILEKSKITIQAAGCALFSGFVLYKIQLMFSIENILIKLFSMSAIGVALYLIVSVIPKSTRNHVFELIGLVLNFRQKR